jgi:hypothetical protein
LIVAGVVTLLAAAPVQAANSSGSETAERLQNVPNSTSPGSELVQGDQWTFYGRRGGTVHLKIDTRDDFGNNTSGLDPVLILTDSRGNVLNREDDNTTCSIPQVCGYQCPEFSLTLPADGVYKIIAQDYDSATLTDQQCNGGSYLLSFEGPRSIVNSLSKSPTVDNGIVDEIDLSTARQGK